MKSANFVFALALCAIASTSMAINVSPDPKVFFKSQISGNLTKITWAHAVNSIEMLNQSLSDDKIMMLEADIVLGKIIGSTETIPIMAHPPNDTSNLSLENFLERIVSDGKHGVKLDFKSIEAFEASAQILKKLHDKMTFPVYINADILKGSADAEAQPVDPVKFLSKAAEVFPESILSVGWTTNYPANQTANTTSSSYTTKHIEEMIETLNQQNVTQAVTYPVRAGMAVNNISLWSELLNSTMKNNSTLTIWSHDDDYVDAPKLSKLIKSIGTDKIYVDVPKSLWEKLNVTSATADKLPGIFTLLTIITANFILSIL